MFAADQAPRFSAMGEWWEQLWPSPMHSDSIGIRRAGVYPYWKRAFGYEYGGLSLYMTAGAVWPMEHPYKSVEHNTMCHFHQ